MKREQMEPGFVSRIWLMVILTAALMSIGCDNNINVTEPDIPEANSQTILIAGTMSAEQGACNEATILYDRQELEGARTECADTNGCTQLELQSDYFRTNPGLHRVAFQVVSQSRSRVEYTIEGEVSAPSDPEGRIPFGPTIATLSPGEIVNFQIVIPPRIKPPPGHESP